MYEDKRKTTNKKKANLFNLSNQSKNYKPENISLQLIVM